MPTDRHAVIWTRVGGNPLKMADIVATLTECRITYTQDFIDSGLPGFSLVAEPTVVGRETLSWRATGNHPLHPRLMAMIPPANADNVQRRIYREILSRRPHPPAPGFETEWELLLLAGRNGIGHLDIFSDDIVASQWYERQALAAPTAPSPASRSRIWATLKDEIQQHTTSEHHLDELAGIIGATPSAGGMITKVLLSIPNQDIWTGEFSFPVAHTHDDSLVDVIVKLEAPQYEGMRDMEALCLDVHREAGFDVPRSWLLDIVDDHGDSLKLLAIERFDRTPDGLPIPFESLMTVFIAGSKTIRSGQDVTWPDVGRLIATLGKVCNLDILKTQELLFKRLAFALMTGNGDMHLDNLALIGGTRNARLSPVFDPAPMRAWLRHNLRMSVPIDFDHDIPIYTQIAGTGSNFGMTAIRAKEILGVAMKETANFTDRVMELNGVPTLRRKALADIVRTERKLLEQSISKTDSAIGNADADE